MYGYGIPKGSKCKTARVKVLSTGEAKKRCRTYAKPGEKFDYKVEIRYSNPTTGRLSTKPITKEQKKVKKQIEIRYVSKQKPATKGSKTTKTTKVPVTKAQKKVEKAAEILPEVVKTVVEEVNKKYKCLSEDVHLIQYLIEKEIPLDKFIENVIDPNKTFNELDKYYVWLSGFFEDEIDIGTYDPNSKKEIDDNLAITTRTSSTRGFINNDMDYDFKNKEASMTKQAFNELSKIEDKVARFLTQQDFVRDPKKLQNLFSQISKAMNQESFPYLADEMRKLVSKNIDDPYKITEEITNYISDEIFELAGNYMRDNHMGEKITKYAIDFTIRKDPELTNFFNYIDMSI